MNKEKKHNKLVPELRFPEFENDGDWKYNILGIIATFSKGKSVSKKDIVSDGKLFCIRYGELYTRYNEVIDEVISRTNLPKNELNLSKKNDVIIPSSGETRIDIARASCVLREGIALGGDLNIIRSKINGVFFSYYLNSAKKRAIAKMAQGVSVMHLYNSQLEKLEIEYPDNEKEQQKIANCLSSLDNVIGAENEKLDHLKDHKKGLLQQLFPANGETKPQFRFPEFANDGDWTVDELKDLILMVSPPKKLKSSEYQLKGKYPIIDQSQNDIAGWSNDVNAIIKNERILIVFGDHTCILKIIDIPFIQGADGIKVFEGKKNIDTRYLYYSLQNNPLKMEEYKRHFSKLKERQIPYPEIETGEQQKIAEFLSSLDDLIESQTEKIEALKEHKKGLMQQLFPSINNNI